MSDLLERQRDLRRLSAQTATEPRLPVPPLELEGLPPALLKAFPDLDEWQRRNNLRLKVWAEKMTTSQGGTEPEPTAT